MSNKELEEIVRNLHRCMFFMPDYITKNYCKRLCSRKMPFGKYKGANVAFLCLIDRQYIEWLIENTEFRLNHKEQALYEFSEPILLSQGGFSICGGAVEEAEFKSDHVDFKILEKLPKND